MPIRPIDIQMTIQRANEYTKEASLQNQKVSIDQFANTRQFQQVIEKAQRQVISTGHIYHSRIDKEPDRKNRRSKHVKSHQEKDRKGNHAILNGETQEKEMDKGSNVDIRI